MFVASPSANLSSYVSIVAYAGSVVNTRYSYDNAGFRPVVCLQSNVKLEKQQDGSFLLK